MSGIILVKAMLVDTLLKAYCMWCLKFTFIAINLNTQILDGHRNGNILGTHKSPVKCVIQVKAHLTWTYKIQLFGGFSMICFAFLHFFIQLKLITTRKCKYCTRMY